MTDKPMLQPKPNLFHQDLLEEVLLRPEPGAPWYEMVVRGVAEDLLEAPPNAAGAAATKRSRS